MILPCHVRAFLFIKHFLVLAVTDAKWIFTGIYYIGTILKKILTQRLQSIS